MKLKFKTAGDLVLFQKKAIKSGEAMVGLVEFDVGIKEDEAYNWGEEFAVLAFGTLRVLRYNEIGEPLKKGFLVDAIKPGKNVVFEYHQIKINGHKVKAQPKILNIKTNSRVGAVVIKLQIEIPSENIELLDYLAKAKADVMKIEFMPLQGMLDFSNSGVVESEILGNTENKNSETDEPYDELLSPADEIVVEEQRLGF
jgi:hypothetical protein